MDVLKDSSRPVREMLKALARAAADYEYHARRSEEALARAATDATPPLRTSKTVLAVNEAMDQAKASAARELLKVAVLHAGVDDDGRMWVSLEYAAKIATALFRVAAAGHSLEDVFDGRTPL